MDRLADDLEEAGRPRWLIRLAAGLSPWTRPSVESNLEPAVTVTELRAWARDDGRWDPRATKDWQSLFDDLHVAWLRLGPELKKLADVDSHLDALREVRAQGKISVESRPTVEAAGRALEIAFDGQGALPAAIDDLFQAARRSSYPNSLDEETRWRLALLASVSERHGHDWAVIANRFRTALETTRGSPLNESIEAVHKGLKAPAARGHSIVWLAIDHAYAWGQPQDSAIRLFDGDWLLAVLRNWNGPRDGVPPELAADPQRLPDVCKRIDQDADPSEQLPVAFARIDLGDGPVAGARDRAHETLELLVARASSRLPGSTWKIRNVVLHYVSGDVIFEAAGPIGDPDVYTRLVRTTILEDRTADAITEQVQRLRAQIPAGDSRLHDALQLSKWLTTAREASPPARLILSGRIIEQAANWAELGVKPLIDDCLSWAWARNKVAGDLANAGFHGMMRLPVHSRESKSDEAIEARREIINEAKGQVRLRTFAVLGRLDWLIEQHSAETETGDYLRELQQRLVDGPAAAAWMDELRDELKVLNARAVRTRNALVHGGPLVAAIVDTVVAPQDSLGSQALEWVIDGLVAGRPLPDVFVEQRKHYLDAVEGLRAGGNATALLETLLRL